MFQVDSFTNTRFGLNGNIDMLVNHVTCLRPKWRNELNLTDSFRVELRRTIA